jgi:hypothetical protein
VGEQLMDAAAIVPGFVPESPLERALAADPLLMRGLAWGTPRPGHPEGRVGRHSADIIAGIDDRGEQRQLLRFLALAHDAFKSSVRAADGYSRNNDHAVLARRFAERYTADARLLEALELHDLPYHIWRSRRTDGRAALAAALDRVPDPGLFLRFVELDGSTAGKDLGLLAWVRASTASQVAL